MAGPMVIDLRKSIRSTYDADDDWLAGRRRRGGALGSWKDWRAWNAANPGKPKDSRGRWTDSPMDQEAQRGGLFKVDEGIFIRPDERLGFRNEYGHFITDLESPEELAARLEDLDTLTIEEAEDQLADDLDRGTRGAFSRLYGRPVQSTGYDQEPGRFGRGRLQVSGKGAMIIDLQKAFSGLTPDLTKRKRGGVWTAADEAKINRDGRGRFAEKRDQMVGILGHVDSEQRRDATRQMDDFLRGLVQETGGGNTKLGRALMEIVGPGEHVAAKPTGPKADPGKPLTATGRGKQVTPETLREIGEIRARPMPGDRDRLNELFMGMTVAQMGHVAGLHGSTMQPAGDKKQKANQLVETMIGHRLNSDKIRFGSWNERDDATGTRIKAINDRMKETTDREEYGRLHIEREALSNGGNVDDRPKPKPAAPDPGKPLTATGARIKKEDLGAAHAEVDEIEAKAEPTGNDAARLKNILSRMTVPQIKEAGKRHGLTVFPGRTKAEHIQSVADMIVGEKIKHRRIAEMVDETDFYGDKRRDRKQTAQQLAELPIESASLDRARALIGGMTAGGLRALAREIGPTVVVKGNKRELVESIVEGTVGFRLKAKTMNPGGWGSGSLDKPKSAKQRAQEDLDAQLAEYPMKTPAEYAAEAAVHERQLHATELEILERRARLKDPSQWSRVERERLEELRAKYGQGKPPAPRHSDKPLIENAGESLFSPPGSVAFHPHGAIGYAILDMGPEGRSIEVEGDALANVLGRTLTDSVAGRITPRQELDRLKAIRDQVPVGTKARTRLDQAIQDLDAPVKPMPSLPASTPAPLRQLAQELNDMPSQHRPRHGREDQTTELQMLTSILQRWDAGDPEVRPMALARELRKLRDHRHESEEGRFSLQRAVDKATEGIEEQMRARQLVQPKPGSGSAGVARTPGMPLTMQSALTTIDNEGGLEMKKADFQTEYGLSDREMNRLINEGLIETDDRAGPGYIGLTDAGNAALRAMRGAGPTGKTETSDQIAVRLGVTSRAEHEAARARQRKTGGIAYDMPDPVMAALRVEQLPPGPESRDRARAVLSVFTETELRDAAAEINVPLQKGMDREQMILAIVDGALKR